jgi:hypothetical protein
MSAAETTRPIDKGVRSGHVNLKVAGLERSLLQTQTGPREV